jgi:hypothetical protein
MVVSIYTACRVSDSESGSEPGSCTLLRQSGKIASGYGCLRRETGALFVLDNVGPGGGPIGDLELADFITERGE